MKKGFSLLESVIYIALTSLIISVLVSSAYQIIEGNSAFEARSLQYEEIDFIIHKIEWVLDDVREISFPAIGMSGEILEVYRNDYQDNPIRLEFSLPAPGGAGTLTMKTGNNPPALLSSDILSLTDLRFERLNSTSTLNFLKVIIGTNKDSFEIIKYLPN